MADLDDFFAKKDKKKTKTKKFLSAEELAKKLEDTSKKAAEPLKLKKERPLLAGGASGENSELRILEQSQEDEWKDFEQEERKDYTGLKIGQMTLTEDDNLSSSGIEIDLTGTDTTGTDATNTDVEGTPRNLDNKVSFGPWKKVADESTTGTSTTVTSPSVDQQVETPSKVYISPALRNQPSKSLKGRHRDAPDITNEEYFPTLGASRPEERKKKNEPAFEEVRHGSRVTHRIQDLQKNASISVGNRFKSLQDDDS